MGGPCVIELMASPGTGANNNGQFGSDCALNEPSPLQLAVIGPGVPVTIGVAVGVGAGAGVAVEAEGAEPPPPHPAKTSAHIIDVVKDLTPGNFILHPQCLERKDGIGLMVFGRVFGKIKFRRDCNRKVGHGAALGSRTGSGIERLAPWMAADTSRTRRIKAMAPSNRHNKPARSPRLARSHQA